MYVYIHFWEHFVKAREIAFMRRFRFLYTEFPAQAGHCDHFTIQMFRSCTVYQPPQGLNHNVRHNVY